VCSGFLNSDAFTSLCKKNTMWTRAGSVYRYLGSVSVFGIFVGIFYVGSVFGIGILKYIGIRYRYF